MRRVTEPEHARGRRILRALESLGEGFTLFAQNRGISFSAWHRIVHAEGDPNGESTILAKVVQGGVPLELVAPTLAEALLERGWRAPKGGNAA